MGNTYRGHFRNCRSLPLHLSSIQSPHSLQQSRGFYSNVFSSFILVILAKTVAFDNFQEQKFLIGVILMVPCYAIESVSESVQYSTIL